MKILKKGLNIYVYFLFYVLENTCSQTTSSACQSCLIPCKDAWWENKLSATICAACLSYCMNETQELAFFFRNHACIEVDSQTFVSNRATILNSRQGRLSNAYCEGLNNVMERTVRTSLLRLYGQCKSELNTMKDLIKAYRVENAIIEQYPERFTDESAMSGRNAPQIRRGEVSRELCPSYTTITWPLRASHASGITVELVQRKRKKQYFHLRSCLNKRPTPTVGSATCKVGKNKHKAIIRVSRKDYIKAYKTSNPIRNCRTTSSSYLVCDDWIELNGYCTVKTT